MVFAVEREEVMLYVEVKDPSAPVLFYINGKKLDEGEFRFEHTSSGGKHEFKIKKCELGDAGCLEARTPSNKVTSCRFPLPYPKLHLPRPQPRDDAILAFLVILFTMRIYVLLCYNPGRHNVDNIDRT